MQEELERSQSLFIENDATAHWFSVKPTRSIIYPRQKQLKKQQHCEASKNRELISHSTSSSWMNRMKKKERSEDLLSADLTRTCEKLLIPLRESRNTAYGTDRGPLRIPLASCTHSPQTCESIFVLEDHAVHVLLRSRKMEAMMSAVVCALHFLQTGFCPVSS